MTDPNSNRNDPEVVSYFQNMADVLGIFWEFHNERLESGNIQFAYEENTVEAFDPMRKITRWRTNHNLQPHDVISDFSNAVKYTLNGSWRQFLKGLDVDLGPYPFYTQIDTIPVTDEQTRFFDPYTKALAQRTDEQTALAKASVEGNFSLNSVGDAGIHTGALGTVQLAALFGENFRPNTGVMLSKVKQINLGAALKEIGLSESYGSTHADSPAAQYTLLDNSELGLKRGRLQELGLGSTIGCPASMPISIPTRNSLRDKGIITDRRTVLERFGTMMPDQFNHYVGEWYTGLTPEQKNSYVHPEQNNILSGEARRKTLADQPHCPYGKER